MVNSGILIVTNERNVAQDLRECLIKLGYKVVGIATSNEEIIAKIEETKPELILTDIQLERGKGGNQNRGTDPFKLRHTHYLHNRICRSRQPSNAPNQPVRLAIYLSPSTRNRSMQQLKRLS